MIQAQPLMLLSVLLAPGSLTGATDGLVTEPGLAFSPADGLARVSSFTFELELKTDDQELVLGEGQVLMQDSDPERFDTRTLQVRDCYRNPIDGRPGRIERSFIEVDREMRLEGLGAQVHADLPDMSSPLEGLAVAFDWDAKEEAYAPGWMEDEGDEDWLTGLAEDMSLRTLLPRGDASVGDAWDIDPEALQGMLTPGGELWPRGERSDSGEHSGGLRLDVPNGTEMVRLSEYEGVLRGTLEGLREVEGRELAEISLTLDLSTHASDDEEFGRGENDYEIFELARSLSGGGTLLWDVEAGVFASFELDLDVEYDLEAIWTQEFAGSDVGLSFVQVQSGSLHIEATSGPDVL